MPHTPFRRLVSPDPSNGVKGDKVYADTFNDIYTAIENSPTMDDLAIAAAAPQINAKHPDYGAIGDNSTNDRTAIQSAIQAAKDGGIGVVYLPQGTYAINNYLDILEGVTLRGDGPGLTTLKLTAGAPAVRLRENNTALENLTVDVNSVGVIGVQFIAATGTLHNAAVRHCRLTGGAGNSIVRFSGDLENIEVSGNLVEDTQGMSAQATSINGLRIIGNTFRGMESIQPTIQLSVSSDIRPYTNILIADNDIADATELGAIPIELGGIERGVVRGNTIDGGTRAISTGKCTDLLMADNAISNQTVYAFEIGASQQVSIIGNVTSNCAALVHETGNGGPVIDLVIANNTYANSGAASEVSGGNAVKLAHGATRVAIIGNIFTDWDFLREAIRIGETTLVEDVLISGNIFTVTSADTWAEVINVRKGARVVITGNMIRVHRNLVAGDDPSAPIRLSNDASNTGLTVTNNHIQFTGTTASSPNTAGITDGGANAYPGVVIQRNHVLGAPYGLKLAITSTDMIVTDNETRTCTNADTIPSTALKRALVRYEGTAAPASGTWRRGDVVWNTAPSAAGTLLWCCTTAGSPGTWTALTLN